MGNMISFRAHILMIYGLLAIVFLIMLTFTIFVMPSLIMGLSNNTSDKNIDSSLSIQKNIQGSHVRLENNIMSRMVSEGLIDDYGRFFGNSMQPTLFEGNTLILYNFSDSIVLKPGMMVRFRNYDVDECLVVKQTDIIDVDYVTHRVVAVYDERVVTSGDNNVFTEMINKCQITHIIVGVIYT